MVVAKAWIVGAFIALMSSAHQPGQPGLRGTTAGPLVRVSPTKFLAAPASIRQALLERGCLIPQDTTSIAGLHNVIRGTFSGRRTSDWAALCSRRGVTTLLVLRVGASIRVDSLNATADDAGRRIGAAEPAYMWSHAEFYAEAPRDTAGLKRLLMHQGIEDGSGCCSVIYFWDGRRWRNLPGAD
jgi:hypothetical protein